MCRIHNVLEPSRVEWHRGGNEVPATRRAVAVALGDAEAQVTMEKAVTL